MSISEIELRGLLDKQQIHDVMMRYCRAVDRMDIALLKTCYWPDGVDDHGPFKGSAEDLFKVIGGMSDVYDMTQHLICNEYVELNGDQACSESYFMMPAGMERDGRKIWVLGGRYIDIFERRGGEWRIMQRTVTYDWETILPGAEAAFETNPFQQRKRSIEDIVYRTRSQALGAAR